MKMLLGCAMVCGFVAVAGGQQQRQSPFVPPAAGPPAGQRGGQPNTPNQGVATDPAGNLGGQAQIVPPTDPALGASGGLATNALGRPTIGQNGPNQAAGGNAPLFLGVTPVTITDANGQPIGILQQIVLTPSGGVNFGLVNMGGRLIPVPWQVIVTSGAAGRTGLALNVESGIFRTAPPVAMGQLPLLTQEEIQAQIFGHFGLAPPAQTVVTTGTAMGSSRGSGVTLTGGSTNTTSFNTNVFANRTNAAPIPNNVGTNQAINTTSGLLSPTGQTNAAQDPYQSGRAGQNARPPAPPSPAPATPNSGGQPNRQP